MTEVPQLIDPAFSAREQAIARLTRASRALFDVPAEEIAVAAQELAAAKKHVVRTRRVFDSLGVKDLEMPHPPPPSRHELPDARLLRDVQAAWGTNQVDTGVRIGMLQTGISKVRRGVYGLSREVLDNMQAALTGDPATAHLSERARDLRRAKFGDLNMTSRSRI